jgi:hypothetical protein
LLPVRLGGGSVADARAVCEYGWVENEEPTDVLAVLDVLFGEVVLDDADGGGPSERSVGSVVIAEVDESGVGVGSLGL